MPPASSLGGAAPDRLRQGLPAELPQRAEEVSEEDSPVEILAPEHAVFNDTPLLATWDKGHAPGKGGWLTARYGKGHHPYFAYAFHRQLPYGVPGAYRLLANVLSLNKPKPGSPTSSR